MIPIIICSINPSLLKQVSKNIEETIGLPFEIIAIDNQMNKYGICEAYNYGAKHSKFQNLCFIHEDIIFHTQNWGQNLFNHLLDNIIGLVGIAGGLVKSRFHSSWWNSLPEKSFQRKNIVQHSGENKVTEYQNPTNEIASEVLFIDGLFMACRKEIWEKYPFDEINFPGFHFYDLDFSFSVQKHYKVEVVYDILIEHLSPGSYKTDWILSSENFTKKWKYLLPVYLIELSDFEKKSLELNAIRFFINACINEKLIKKTIKTYLSYLIKLPDLKSIFVYFKRIIIMVLKKISLSKKGV